MSKSSCSELKLYEVEYRDRGSKGAYFPSTFVVYDRKSPEGKRLERIFFEVARSHDTSKLDDFLGEYGIRDDEVAYYWDRRFYNEDGTPDEELKEEIEEAFDLDIKSMQEATPCKIN